MNTMNIPGFTAENSLYKGTTPYCMMSGRNSNDSTDVIPQLSIADVFNFLFGDRGGGGDAAAGAAVGAAVGALAGPAGAGLGAGLGATVGRQVGCLVRRGRLCDD